MFDAMAAARALEPLIRATADEAEAARRFPRQVIDAMAEARIFRQLVPRVAGGDEMDPITTLNVVEFISRVDGSAGWLAMIGSGAGSVTGYLDATVGREMFADPLASLCGNLGATGGRALVAPGGYRVSGRWPFVSGCEHSTWLAGNTLVFEGDQQRFNADGSPAPRIMLFPRSEVRILDTWSATGLRATGSHDVVVTDVFVPQEHSLWWDRPKQPGPLYPVRFMLTTHAAHALGLARAAIDNLVALAEHKQPTRSLGVKLRDIPQMHVALAEAEALVQGARAFMWDITAEVWGLLCAGQPVLPRHRALLRLAMTHAVRSSAQAVDLVWAAAGSSPVYTSSPLERCFRDIHVATQHAAVGVFSLEPIGAALIDDDVARLLI